MDHVPSFSRDGRSIYFTSTRSGQQQVWRIPIEGEEEWPGSAVQVTREGGLGAVESMDGEYVYYVKESGTQDGRFSNEIWRVPVEGGKEQPVVKDFYGGWGNWVLDRNGISRIDRAKEAGNDSPWGVYFRDFATNETSKVVPIRHIPFFAGPGLAISPDGRWVVYGASTKSESDLMIMEGFVDSKEK